MEDQASFDLNLAIQRWRDQLAQSPRFRADDLEELESHLFDSHRALRALGLTDEEAFLIAIRRIGTGNALVPEYAAVNGSPVWLECLLWMTTGSMTISTAWYLTTTVLWSKPFPLSAAILFLFAVLVGLVCKVARKGPRMPLGLPIAFLIVSLFCALLRTTFADNRMLGPLAEFPYIERLILHNLTFFVQWVVSACVIAFAALKQPNTRLS